MNPPDFDIRYLFVAIAVALVATACDDAEPPDVDDESQVQQIEASAAAVDDEVHQLRDNAELHLDEAQQRIEEAIEAADDLAEESLELSDP